MKPNLSSSMGKMSLTAMEVERARWEARRDIHRAQYEHDHNSASDDSEEFYEMRPETALQEDPSSESSKDNLSQPPGPRLVGFRNATHDNKATRDYNRNWSLNEPDQVDHSMSVGHEDHETPSDNLRSNLTKDAINTLNENWTETLEAGNGARLKRKGNLAEDNNSRTNKRVKTVNRPNRHVRFAQRLYFEYKTKFGYAAGRQLDKEEYFNALPAGFWASSTPENFPLDKIEQRVVAADKATAVNASLDTENALVHDGIGFIRKISNRIKGTRPSEARCLKVMALELEAAKKDVAGRKAILPSFWPILESLKDRVDGGTTVLTTALDGINVIGESQDFVVTRLEEVIQFMRAQQDELEVGMKLLKEGQ